MSALPPNSSQPSFRQVLRQVYRNLTGIKIEVPPKPRGVPHLFNHRVILDPSLARRIVRTVLSKIEASGGFIAIAILSSGGNPVLCEKSIDLGEAFWQVAIDRAKALAHETTTTTASVRESSATLMHQGQAAGFIGVASPDAKTQQTAVTLAIAELEQAEEERHQAMAFNFDLARAAAAKNPTKKCRSCGRALN